MEDVILDDLVEDGRLVSLAEVKTMLEKAQTEREDLTYEQKIALEHARRFARVNKTTADKLIKDVLAAFPTMEQKYAIRIADLLPQHAEDVNGILQKARMDLSEEQLKSIVDLVDTHYVA